MTMDIRETADRAKIVAQGYRYATTDRYSSHPYKIRSKHRTLVAAERAAKNNNRTIEFLDH